MPTQKLGTRNGAWHYSVIAIETIPHPVDNIKLVIHEIGAAIQHRREDERPQAVKNLARVRHIPNQLY